MTMGIEVGGAGVHVLIAKVGVEVGIGVALGSDVGVLVEGTGVKVGKGVTLGIEVDINVSGATFVLTERGVLVAKTFTVSVEWCSEVCETFARNCGQSVQAVRITAVMANKRKRFTESLSI
ncbi:MAG: hypothetical protein U0670_13075 [Anaerolineae bacterium]